MGFWLAVEGLRFLGSSRASVRKGIVVRRHARALFLQMDYLQFFQVYPRFFRARDLL